MARISVWRSTFVAMALGAASIGMAAPGGAVEPEVAPEPAAAAGGPAAAAPTGMLRVTTSPALPSQITLDGKIADTWGLEWVHVPTGSHEVCFRAVSGYTAPPCQTVTVNADATTTVTGTFVPRGYLRVTTSPAVASQISVDGVPRNNWGLWTDLSVGSHEVCFGAVAGYTPPPCQTVSLTAGTTTDVTGTFTPSSGVAQPGVGYLRAVSSPAVPTQISIDGVAADSWGLNWLELTPGSRTVCFSHVQGYTAPECQTVVIAAGQTTTTTATFAPRGYLRVDTSPAVAGTITIDGHPADDWGVYTDLPVGTHEVCFGPVAGLVAPGCQSPVVTAGQTTTITGSYRDHWFCLDNPISTAEEQYRALNHHDPVWQGGDGAKTVVLPDGRTVWLFGDSIVGNVNPDGSLPPTGWKLVRGTALIQEGACIDPLVTDANPGEAATLIPQPSFEEFYWPDSGFVDASGTSLWVIAKKVVINPAAPWGFDIEGQVAARFSLPDLTYQSLVPMPDPPYQGDGGWTLPYVEDGWVHLYADKGFDHYVARFPASDTGWADGQGWEYWTGASAPAPAWSTNTADMRTMAFNSAAIGIMNVVKTPTGYAIVSQFQNEITAWKGSTPTGPWSLIGAVKNFAGTPDACTQNGCPTYLGHAATDLPGVDPLIIWSRAQDVNGSTAGSYLGVDDPDLPLG